MTTPEGIYSDDMVQPSLVPTNGADRAGDRLWLAGMAMQGLVAHGSSDMYNIARQSWAMADAMLEAEYDA